MNTTDTQTWRDYEKQLTNFQLAWIRDFENRYPADLDGGAARDSVLLDYARSHAEQNRVDQTKFRHIPTPVGVRHVGHWEDDGTGRWSRGFDSCKEWVIRIPGAMKGSDRADVDIAGSQYEDGTITWQIYVYADSAVYNADQARQLAAALLEAADELDQLTS